MTPEQIKQAKADNKIAQQKKAEKLFGKVDSHVIKEYQHVFLDSPRGQFVLRDILGKTGVFSPNLTENDLALRNYGVNLMLTIAGVHETPEHLETLFGKFVNALAEYERDITAK